MAGTNGTSAHRSEPAGLNILVATASRHGSTHEIGEQIGAGIFAALSARGVIAHVDVRDAGAVTDLSPYDAAIIGSAVYMGRWLKSARQLVDRQEPGLRSIPVWLFSSGPVIPEDEAAGTNPAPTVDWAREHRTFGGKLDRAALGRAERLVASMVHATDGDNRPTPQITAWAREIGESLAATCSR